jgi:hypothetical protein
MMRQISGESIAQIHHGVNGKVLRQPARFREARLEIQMFAANRTAQFAGDEDGVADFRARAQDRFIPGHKAGERNRNQDALGIRGRLAADDGDAVLRASAFKPT